LSPQNVVNLNEFKITNAAGETVLLMMMMLYGTRRSLPPRGPRLTGDGSAQVHEPLTTSCTPTGVDPLQTAADQPFHDQEEAKTTLQSTQV